MAQTFDVTFKLLFRRSQGVFTRMLFGEVTEWPNVEQPTVRNQRPDLLARSVDGILRHVEIQVSNDPKIPLRMLDYYVGFHRLFGEHVEQTLLYVGREPLRMEGLFVTPSTNHEFPILNLREMDGTELLASDDWADNEWALLTKTDPEKVIRVVIEKLRTLSGEQQREAATTFVLLGGIIGMAADLKRRLGNEMIDIMENEVFGPLIRQGRREGVADILTKLLERRFGQLPEWASFKINSATQEELEAWTLQSSEASSLETLLT